MNQFLDRRPRRRILPLLLLGIFAAWRYYITCFTARPDPIDAAIDRTLALTPKLRRLFLDGLAEIVRVAARQADADFVALDAARQEEILRAVEEAEPTFFTALVEHTYRGYYTLPEVHAAIGYTTRPPQPLGHELAPFREELLQVQLGRTSFWRRAT